MIEDMTGACVPTVHVAALLMMLPAGFVTWTRNFEPLSAKIVAGVLHDGLVAPGIFILFFCH